MSPTRRELPRRELLRTTLGLAALATGAGLAACSGNEAGQGVSSTAGPASVAASKVPIGGGIVLEGKRYVVTQPSKGTYRAFSSVCPHAGCNVSAVRDGLIVCPCHDSHFKIADGSVAQGPATKGLTAATVSVDGSDLKVSA